MVTEQRDNASSPLALEDGVFELGGAEPIGLWVQTCPVEVFVGIQALERRGEEHVGHDLVRPSGDVSLVPERGESERLHRVWAAFRERHPRSRERFARRDAVMKELGARVVPQQAAKAQPKVGRNDPCPCGSGKKHRKCCGSK